VETSTYPHTYPKTRRFLIMEGGPFYRIERRVGLIRENPPRTIRSAVLAACLTWLVLLILSALNGAAAGEGVELPFLHDFSAYGRFLLAIPLLLMAERVLGPRIADTAERFLLANIVTQTDFNRFDAAIERGLLRRDSVVAELIIALLAYALSVVAFRSLTVPSTTWYAAPVKCLSHEDPCSCLPRAVAGPACCPNTWRRELPDNRSQQHAFELKALLDLGTSASPTSSPPSPGVAFSCSSRSSASFSRAWCLGCSRFSSSSS